MTCLFLEKILDDSDSKGFVTRRVSNMTPSHHYMAYSPKTFWNVAHFPTLWR